MILLLFFSISTLFLCGFGGPSCDPLDFHFDASLDNFHIPYSKHSAMDCNRFNTGKLTYTLKVRHNGMIKDLDSFGCAEDHSPERASYYYKVNGTSNSINYSRKDEVQYYCAVPIDRMCKNPQPFCYGSYCPKYTEGSDKEAAKFECPEGKWVMHENAYGSGTPMTFVCKAKPEGNGAKFYDGVGMVSISSGMEEFNPLSTLRCKRNTTPIPEKKPEQPTFSGGSSYYGSTDSKSKEESNGSLVALYVCCGIMALVACVVGIICCMRRTRGVDHRMLPNNLAADYPRQGAPSPGPVPGSGPVPCPGPNSNRPGSNSDVESQ